MEWQKLFEGVPDFRLNRKKRHKLSDMLMLSLCMMVSGADDFEEMQNYGKQKESFLCTYIDLAQWHPFS